MTLFIAIGLTLLVFGFGVLLIPAHRSLLRSNYWGDVHRFSDSTLPPFRGATSEETRQLRREKIGLLYLLVGAAFTFNLFQFSSGVFGAVAVVYLAAIIIGIGIAIYSRGLNVFRLNVVGLLSLLAESILLIFLSAGMWTIYSLLLQTT